MDFSKKYWLLFVLTGCVFAAQTQSNILDETFGGGGFIKNFTPPRGVQGLDVVVLNDGKILSACEEMNEKKLLLLRYQSDGKSLDPTFADDGKFSFDISKGQYFNLAKIKIQPDGKILCLLNLDFKTGKKSDIVLLRLLPDGQLDINFGQQGMAVFDFHGLDDFGGDIEFQAGNKIVIVGRANFNSSRGKNLIFRLLEIGSMDTSFGQNGSFEWGYSPVFNSNWACGIVCKNDQSFVVGTYMNDAGYMVSFLAKFKENGQLDSAFATKGTNFVNAVGTDEIELRCIKFLPDGRIRAGGEYAFGVDSYDLVLVGFKADGSKDFAFGNSSQLRLTASGEFNFLSDMEIQPDSKIVLAGSTQYDGWRSCGAVVRLDAEGKFDKNFADGGSAVLEFGFTEGWGAFSGIALQPDCKIVAIGYRNESLINFPYSAYTMILCRFKKDNLVAADAPSVALSGFEVFPNPVFGSSISAKFELIENGEAAFSLIDAAGRVFENFPFQTFSAGRQTVNFPIRTNIPVGIYFLKMQLGSGQVFARQFLKN